MLKNIFFSHTGYIRCWIRTKIEKGIRANLDISLSASPLTSIFLALLLPLLFFTLTTSTLYADESASTSVRIVFNVAEEAGGAGAVESCTPLCPPTLPLIEATKTDKLIEDLNDNGMVDSGDVVKYEVTLNKIEPSEPRGIVYVDPLSTNIQYIEGSLSSTYESGEAINQTGKTTIYVDFSNGLAEDQALEFPLKISYAAKVRSSLAGTVGAVKGQGIIYSNNSPTTVTDDPNTFLFDEPTVTPIGKDGNVSKERILTVKKKIVDVQNQSSATLDFKQDGNNTDSAKNSLLANRIVGPGSLVHFVVTVENNTGEQAENLELVDSLDRHMVPQTGSTKLNGKPVKAYRDNRTGVMRLEISALSAGETSRLSYWARVEENINPDLGHLGSSAYISGESIIPNYSDDPATEILGDRTSLLLGSNCTEGNYLSKWELWLERLANAKPTLTPIILSPGTGQSSGGAAAYNAVKEEEVAGKKEKDELAWVIFGGGGGKKISNYYQSLVGGSAGAVPPGGREEEEPDSIYKYWPRYAFFGAGNLSITPGTGELYVGLNVDDRGAGGAGGTGSGTHTAYIQSSPNLPIYKRLTADSGYRRLGIGDNGVNNICGEEYLPFILNMALSGSIGPAEGSDDFGDLFKIVRSE